MTLAMPDFDLPDTMALRPTRHPTVGDREFRTAMASMAATVSVVTARRGDEVVGRTATSVMSLSLTPPAILVSIDIMSRMADLIAKTGGFSLAMLAHDQHDVADAFAGRHDPANRFGFGQWDRWPSGHPHLRGALTALDCEVIGSIETGTHVLFAGAVIEVEGSQRAPLIWQDRAYRTIAGLD